ncbi:MAG: hypothetical protein H8E05_00500 [Bacteroidetes bacterium]|nr:hypothetical protein [Bacteroidota bacterium]
MATHQYIYGLETQEGFYEKLDSFHETHVENLIMNGLAKQGDDLESIKMTKSPFVTEQTCKRIIGGLKNVKPEIILKLRDDMGLVMECIFTHINDGDFLNEVYMIQNVHGWPEDKGFSCQIWNMQENTGINEIKLLWDE